MSNLYNTLITTWHKKNTNTIRIYKLLSYSTLYDSLHLYFKPYLKKLYDTDYFNDDNQYQYTASKGTNLNKSDGKRQKNMEHRRHRGDQELPSFLDDTASSPLINFSKVSSPYSYLLLIDLLLIMVLLMDSWILTIF